MTSNFGEYIMNNNICNFKDICNFIGCSPNKGYKLIALGLPFHQLSADTRRYFIKTEVVEWLESAGYSQQTTWKK